MKTSVTILAFVLLCTACKQTTFSMIKPDGSVLRARDTRFGMNTGVELTAAFSTNSVSITAKAQSSPDAAMAESIARGVATGLKPVP